MLRDMFISEHVTLRNDSSNLCFNGATKLRDKLQEKLSSVTVPHTSEFFNYDFIFSYLLFILEGQRVISSITVTCNLIPRVLRLFGQLLVARKD